LRSSDAREVSPHHPLSCVSVTRLKRLDDMPVLRERYLETTLACTNLAEPPQMQRKRTQTRRKPKLTWDFR